MILNTNINNRNFLKWYSKRITAIEFRMFIKRNFIHSFNIEVVSLLEMLILAYKSIYEGDINSIQEMNNVLETMASHSSHMESLLEDLEDDNLVPYMYLNYYFGTPNPPSNELEFNIMRDFNMQLRNSARNLEQEFHNVMEFHNDAAELLNLENAYLNRRELVRQLERFYQRQRRERYNLEILERRHLINLNELRNLERHHRNAIRRGHGLHRQLLQLRNYIRNRYSQS